MALVGQTGIVTGGGSGIGQAVARALGGQGAAVVVADVAAEAAEASAAAIVGAGGRALAVPTDVADPASVQRLVDHAVAEYGAIDALVHCAGITRYDDLLELPVETWDRLIAVNLRGTFLCTQAVLRQMVPRRRGRVILFASQRGVDGQVRASHYAASKGGVIAFMRSVALEMAPHEITVNAVAPGITNTPMWRGTKTAEEIDRLLQTQNIGEPEEAVGMVLMLLGDDAALVSGQLIMRQARLTR
jgi:NAD(P)-dependent dehydrogenase (short-subunit alcohol dehydrogenase family)